MSFMQVEILGNVQFTGETLPKFRQKVSCPKSSLVKEDIVLRSKPGVSVMSGSPQGSSRVPGNSERVLFLGDEDIVAYIEEHHELFLSAMYNVYRATDVTFTGENQLEDARAFSRRILERETMKDCMNLVRPISMTNLQCQ
ncbi:unnamed protein product, partial [Prunus armeniaca]